MRFLLDSNAVIALLKASQTMLERFRRYQPQDFGLPSIVAHELYFGAYRSERREENLARVSGLRFEVLEFSAEDARRSGAVRANLAKAGTPIGPYDVLIAGQALSRGLVLVTRNGREFSRVPSLLIEDWEG